MSSVYSMYIVPEEWKLQDCMCVAYMRRCEFMMSKEEFIEYHNQYKKKNWERLFDELERQPCLCEYACTDGDPDFPEIMKHVPLTGKLCRFSEKAFELIPRLESFMEEHKGKRYICMN